MKNAVESLRALADHLEAHPELAARVNVSAIVVARDADEFAAFTRQLGGTIDNPARKVALDTFLETVRSFGTIDLSVVAERAKTCERVQVGTAIVRKPVLFENVEEPQYEWVCPPSFLATAS